MKKRFVSIVLALLFVLSLCVSTTFAQTSDDLNQSNNYNLTIINDNKDIVVGDKGKFEVKVTNKSGDKISSDKYEVSYKAYDIDTKEESEDFILHSNGEWTAKNKSEVSVYATITISNNIIIRDSINIQVYDKVEDINLNLDKDNYVSGESIPYTLDMSPQENIHAGEYKGVVLSSSNPSVVKVASDDELVAVSEGNAVITCYAKNNISVLDRYEVRVTTPVDKIDLNTSSLTIYPGKKYTLSATVSPQGADDKSVTYSSSDDSIATVNSVSGEITGVKSGNAIITCKANDGSNISSTCEVTVGKYVTSVSVSKSKYSGKIGDKFTLGKSVNPSDATNKNVKFYSSNKYVASVSSTGEVKLVGPGSAKIYCSSVDGSGKKAYCNIYSKAKKRGWYTYGSRKYYILKNLTPAKGRKKIGSSYYYFSNSTGAMVRSKWVYTKVSGKKYKLYFTKSGKQSQNVSSLIGKRKSYRVEVNTRTNYVTIYAKDGKNGYIIPVKAMICSTGVNGNGTVKGTFKLRRAGRWHQLMGDVYGQYCTQISGNYLFHSVWYYSKGNHKSITVSGFKALGRKASHGCVRLKVADAKWIYSNCIGSKVKVFSSKKSSPLKKPKRPRVVRVRGDRGYDPSDPHFR